MKNEFLTPAPKNYVWPLCPEAEHFIEGKIQQFLNQHKFAGELAHRMQTETSSPFSCWVDHVLLPARGCDKEELKWLGFWEDTKARRPVGTKIYFHPYADLPKLLVSAKTKNIGCALMVEDIWKFQLAHSLSLPIVGAPYSTYRMARMTEAMTDFLIVERRGTQNFVADMKNRAEIYLTGFELWANRQRQFPSEDAGMKHTLNLARALVKKLGAGLAAHIFLEGERAYWESRNRAGQVQKMRQDKLGLGWANHDHHTFRSSRAQFATLIEILLTFGFKKRERYYAGAEAGWGAQIMEQPEDGTIIFADVDLAAEDVTLDFSKVVMKNLQKHRTVGLWCALHGESMLQGGMHHLEAKFDFDQLKSDLKERSIETMPPFSDFSFLRQAFTKGEMWKVDSARLENIRAMGTISDEAYQQIKANGAVGSHLENLQRRDGFKGFNQKGVSSIITAVNPEKLALQKQDQGGA